MEKINCRLIMGQMQEWVENKIPVQPSRWIDASAKLIVLIGDEHDKLYELESFIAQKKADHIKNGETASASKIFVEALPEYKEMRKQKAYIDQIMEFSRLAKARAKMKDEEYWQN